MSDQTAQRVAARFVAARPKEARTYQRIVMFDFDGTLFRSWEKTPEWWKGTELDNGPFSFFLNPESLDEPCVPEHPASNYWIEEAVSGAKEAMNEGATYMVLITGRVAAHKPRIIELLSQKGIRFDKMYFNPGMSAARFKVAVLKSLLAGYNSVSSVEIWENENMSVYDAALRATATGLDREVKVEVHHIHVPPKELVCGPQDFGLPSQNTMVIPQSQHTLEMGRVAAETGNGSKVGLFIALPPQVAQQFAEKEEDPSPPHVTFLYVGKVPKDREDEFLGVLETAFASLPEEVSAALTGMDAFVNQTNKVVYSRVRFSHDLSLVRDVVWRKLLDAGFEVIDSFPRWNPHVTVAYLDAPDHNWKGIAPVGRWSFSSIEVWGLKKKHEIAFGHPVTSREFLPEIGAQRVARIMAKRAHQIALRRLRG